jgi:hypothetical protein
VLAAEIHSSSPHACTHRAGLWRRTEHGAIAKKFRITRPQFVDDGNAFA